MSIDEMRVSADRCEWIVVAGDLKTPFYLTVDGTWSSTMEQSTAWFADRESAESARPKDVKSRSIHLAWRHACPF